jgi:hypothetical protein
MSEEDQVSQADASIGWWVGGCGGRDRPFVRDVRVCASRHVPAASCAQSPSQPSVGATAVPAKDLERGCRTGRSAVPPPVRAAILKVVPGISYAVLMVR